MYRSKADDEAKWQCSVEKFRFGATHVFQNGLRGFIQEKDLKRSVQQECLENDDGKYASQFKYVAFEKCVEKQLKDNATGKIRHFEKNHGGWTIDNFLQLPEAVRAKLRRCHMVVLRLYSGKLYAPWNSALRKLIDMESDRTANAELLKWATCISILYDALLLLGGITPPMMVSRGVNESKMKLPESFLNPTAGAEGFAGGVEMGFMSTTQSDQVAMDFSGGQDTEGAIFRIQFTAASRGADIKFFSMYPEEEELLFPPFSYLTCRTVKPEGRKKFIEVDASVSTSRPDLAHIDLNDVASVPLLRRASNMPVNAANISENATKLKKVHELLRQGLEAASIDSTLDLEAGTAAICQRRQGVEGQLQQQLAQLRQLLEQNKQQEEPMGAFERSLQQDYVKVSQLKSINEELAELQVQQRKTDEEFASKIEDLHSRCPDITMQAEMVKTFAEAKATREAAWKRQQEQHERQQQQEAQLRASCDAKRDKSESDRAQYQQRIAAVGESIAQVQAQLQALAAIGDDEDMRAVEGVASKLASELASSTSTDGSRLRFVREAKHFAFSATKKGEGALGSLASKRRWFVCDPDAMRVTYWASEHDADNGSKPKGVIEIRSAERAGKGRVLVVDTRPPHRIYELSNVADTDAQLLAATFSLSGFSLSGLAAGHERAHYMTAYRKCEGRAKVGERYVYEGRGADGTGKAYAWYKGDGQWRFSFDEADIGTDTCALYAEDQALSPERIASSSTWKAYVGGKWEVVSGMSVRALSEAQMQQHEQALEQQLAQFEDAMAQSAFGFSLSGLAAGHERAHYMTAYRKCEGRAKVGERYVYEGRGADGTGKAYAWYNGGYWRFSFDEADIGTDRCGLYAVDQALSPERIASSSTWKAYVGGKWEVVSGMSVQEKTKGR